MLKDNAIFQHINRWKFRECLTEKYKLNNEKVTEIIKYFRENEYILETEKDGEKIVWLKIPFSVAHNYGFLR